MQRELAYVLDIVQSARLIQEFIHGVDRQAFRHNQMIQDAIVRRIKIIGEATRHISSEFRSAHPEIPWQQMAGMRNKLIHEYKNVDLNEMWNVIHRAIPTLITPLTPLVPPEEPDK
jgi:uncharacterized protein with HEPN domain